MDDRTQSRVSVEKIVDAALRNKVAETELRSALALLATPEWKHESVRVFSIDEARKAVKAADGLNVAGLGNGTPGTVPGAQRGVQQRGGMVTGQAVARRRPNTAETAA